MLPVSNVLNIKLKVAHKIMLLLKKKLLENKANQIKTLGREFKLKTFILSFIDAFQHLLNNVREHTVEKKYKKKRELRMFARENVNYFFFSFLLCAIKCQASSKR